MRKNVLLDVLKVEKVRFYAGKYSLGQTLVVKNRPGRVAATRALHFRGELHKQRGEAAMEFPTPTCALRPARLAERAGGMASGRNHTH